MKKNIQQLAAMVGVVKESIGNEAMYQVIGIDISKHFDTKIHITDELFLSIFDKYETGEFTDENYEVFVILDGVRVFALVDVEDVRNA